MAIEALELHKYGLERDGDDILTPSPLTILISQLNHNEGLVEVQANMLTARESISNYAVKKNLTIPQWLNEEALLPSF